MSVKIAFIGLFAFVLSLSVPANALPTNQSLICTRAEIGRKYNCMAQKQPRFRVYQPFTISSNKPKSALLQYGKKNETMLIEYVDFDNSPAAYDGPSILKLRVKYGEVSQVLRIEIANMIIRKKGDTYAAILLNDSYSLQVLDIRQKPVRNEPDSFNYDFTLKVVKNI